MNNNFMLLFVIELLFVIHYYDLLRLLCCIVFCLLHCIISTTDGCILINILFYLSHQLIANLLSVAM